MRKSGSMDRVLQPPSARQPLETAQYAPHQSSQMDGTLKAFFRAMMSWINSYLSEDHIVIGDLCEDLRDGQVLAAFLQKVTGVKIFELMTQTGSDVSRRHNLSILARWMNANLGIVPEPDKWSAEGIANKDYSSIIYVMMRLAWILQCPYEFPQAISLAVVKTTTIDKIVKTQTSILKISLASAPPSPPGFTFALKIKPAPSQDALAKKSHESLLSHSLFNIKSTPSGSKLDLLSGSNLYLKDVAEAPKRELDAFDRIFEGEVAGKDELMKSLLVFVNRSLAPLGTEFGNSAELVARMQGGVDLVILVGVVQSVFIPLYRFSSGGEASVEFAVALMREFGITTDKLRAADIAQGDEQQTARCLYYLFLSSRPTA